MAKIRTASSHRWRFFRAGGVDQVRLDTGADIINLEHLDKKLWVALSCPVKGLEFDERTLQLMDADGDGRVRTPEILAAVRWVGDVLKDADELTEERDELPLASIDVANERGKRLHGAAKMILENLGKPDAAALGVDDATRSSEVFRKAILNGDGIVPPDTVGAEGARKVAEEIVACLGGKEDKSGKLGVDQELLDSFFTACEDHASWHATGDASILVLGAETAAAHAALTAIKPKIDDYFARCRLAAFDDRAAGALAGSVDLYVARAAGALSASAAEFADLPLQKVAPERPLDLTGSVNPAWSAAASTFVTAVLGPLGVNASMLTAEDWHAVEARFAAYSQWMSAQKGAVVAQLGIDRVREILAGKTKKVLADAIAEDASLADEAKAITDVERLVRYYRDLHRLLVNFVSFEDFYSRKRPATFQAGTLFLDGRSADLCVQVTDSAKHGALAGLAKTYLAYCTCRRPTGEVMEVAAAFTAGDSDHLMVGRNGIFFDRRGRDWDATITRVVDNPISIGQAFFSPYKRVLRWIEEQVAKRAAAADAAANEKLIGAAGAAGDAAVTGKAPQAKPKFDIGIVAALGVAVGGITAAFGALLDAFFGLGRWMPLGVIAIVLLISGPSMVIAWLKLRQRNLGPILDANGWAVNGRAKVNIPLGGSLTAQAKIPAGAERSLVDPFAEKKRLWPRLLLALAAVAAVTYGLYRAKVEPVKSFIDDEIIERFWPSEKSVTDTENSVTDTETPAGK